MIWVRAAHLHEHSENSLKLKLNKTEQLCLMLAFWWADFPLVSASSILSPSNKIESPNDSNFFNSSAVDFSFLDMAETPKIIIEARI